MITCNWKIGEVILNLASSSLLILFNMLLYTDKSCLVLALLSNRSQFTHFPIETVPVVAGLPSPAAVSPAAAAAAVLSLLDLNLIFGRCRRQLIQNSTAVGGFRVPDLAECNTGTGSC